MYKLNANLMIVLLPLFFFIVSCGGGSGTIEAVSVPDAEFQQFVSDGQKMTPAEFVTWWNDSESRKWKFQLYRDQYTPDSPLTWPDNNSSSTIFESKLINCYRIGKLLSEIYPGENIKVDQSGSSKWDHYYYKLSTGKIINNYNDGKYLYLK